MEKKNDSTQDLQEKIKELEEEKDRLQTGYNNQSSYYQSKIESLTKELSESNEKNNSPQNVLINNLKKARDEKENEFKIFKTSSQAEITKKDKELKTAKETFENTQKILEKTKSDLEKTKSDLEKARQDIKTNETEIKTLKEKERALTKELTTSKSEKEKLVKENQALKIKIENLGKTIKQGPEIIKKFVDNYNEDTTAIKEESEYLKLTMRNIYEKEESLLKEIEDLKKNLNEQQEIWNVEKELLKVENKLIETEKEKILDENHELFEENLKLMSLMEEKDQDIKDLLIELQKFDSKISEVDDTHKENEDSLFFLTQQMKRLIEIETKEKEQKNKENLKLWVENEKLCKKIEMVEKENQDYIKKIIGLEANNKDNDIGLKDIPESSASLEDDEALKSQVRRLNEEKATLCNQYQVQLCGLNEEISNLKEENSKLKLENQLFQENSGTSNGKLNFYSENDEIDGKIQLVSQPGSPIKRDSYSPGIEKRFSIVPKKSYDEAPPRISIHNVSQELRESSPILINTRSGVDYQALYNENQKEIEGLQKAVGELKISLEESEHQCKLQTQSIFDKDEKIESLLKDLSKKEVEIFQKKRDFLIFQKDQFKETREKEAVMLKNEENEKEKLEIMENNQKIIKSLQDEKSQLQKKLSENEEKKKEKEEMMNSLMNLNEMEVKADLFALNLKLKEAQNDLEIEKSEKEKLEKEFSNSLKKLEEQQLKEKSNSTEKQKLLIDSFEKVKEDLIKSLKEKEQNLIQNATVVNEKILKIKEELEKLQKKNSEFHKNNNLLKEKNMKMKKELEKDGNNKLEKEKTERKMLEQEFSNKLKDLEEKAQEKDKKIESLNASLLKINNELQTVKTENNELIKKNHSLQEEYSKMKNEFKNNEISNLNQIEKEKSNRKNLEDELNKLKESNEMQLKRDKKNISSLESNILEIKDELQIIQKEREELEQKYILLKEENSKMKNELENDKNSRLTSLREIVEDKKENLIPKAELTEALNFAEKEKLERKNLEEELKKTLKEFEVKQQKKEVHIASLNEKLSINNEELKTLQIENDNLQNLNNKLKKEYSNLLKEKEFSDSKVEKIEDLGKTDKSLKKQNFEMKMDEMNELVEKLQIENNQLKDEISKLEKEKKEIIDKLENLQKGKFLEEMPNKNFDMKNDEIHELVKNLQTENNQLKDEFSIKITKLEKEKKEILDKFEILQKEKGKLIEEMQNMKNMMEIEEKNKRRLKDEFNKKLTIMEKQKNEASENSQKSLDLLKQENDNLQKINQELTRENQNNLSEIEKLNKKIIDKLSHEKNFITNFQNEKSLMESNIKKLLKEKEELNEKLTEMRKENDNQYRDNDKMRKQMLNIRIMLNGYEILKKNETEYKIENADLKNKIQKLEEKLSDSPDPKIVTDLMNSNKFLEKQNSSVKASISFLFYYIEIEYKKEVNKLQNALNEKIEKFNKLNEKLQDLWPLFTVLKRLEKTPNKSLKQVCLLLIKTLIFAPKKTNLTSEGSPVKEPSKQFGLSFSGPSTSETSSKQMIEPQTLIDNIQDLIKNNAILLKKKEALDICELNFIGTWQVFELFQEILFVFKGLILKNQENDDNFMKLKEIYEEYVKCMRGLNDNFQEKYREFNETVKEEKDSGIRNIMEFGTLFANIMGKISEKKGKLKNMGLFLQKIIENNIEKKVNDEIKRALEEKPKQK